MRNQESTARVSGWVDEAAYVTNLAARLSIERRLIENDFAFVTFIQLLNFRIPMWMSWRSGMTGLLYWTTVNWGRAGDVWDLVTENL